MSGQKIPRINVYMCSKKHRLVTVDVAKGVTPFTVPCRVDGCEEFTRSGFYGRLYGVGFLQGLGSCQPTHEWYSPAPDEREDLSDWERDHVDRGGLLLRERTDAEPIYHPEAR